MDNDQLKPTVSAAENPEQTVAAMSANTPEEVISSSDNNGLQTAQNAATSDAANGTDLSVSGEQANPGDTIPAGPVEQSLEDNQEGQTEAIQTLGNEEQLPLAQKDKRYQNKYAQKHRADLDDMEDGAEKNYLLDRVFPQMKYFSDCSQSYKKKYHVLTILCLIFNGIVPFIMLFDEVSWAAPYVKYVVTAISSTAGILTAILALKKYRELWVQSRICLEQLKRVVSMYFLGAGEFAGMSQEPEKRKQSLFAICENIVINEHNQWTELAQKDEKPNNR